MGVLVRVAGAVPIRLDLSHAGTNEMQLGLSLGTILVYLRTAITAHAIADGWANAALLARDLPMTLSNAVAKSDREEPYRKFLSYRLDCSMVHLAAYAVKSLFGPRTLLNECMNM